MAGGWPRRLIQATERADVDSLARRPILGPMVMKSPFERILDEVAEQATREPLAAFGRLQELYNKSLTDQDVQNLCTLAANLGGAGLGRWDDAITYLQTLLDHPALDQGGATEGSIWRAMAVMHRCAGRKEDAERCAQSGVRTDDDRCRLEVMTAQTLAARGRTPEAIPHLDQAGSLVGTVTEAELKAQCAGIALAIARAAEQQTLLAREVLLATNRLIAAVDADQEAVEPRHQARYQQAHAAILAGDPRTALDLVQELMELEAEHDVPPERRFFTITLAVRAQLLRGQVKTARQAFGAAADLAGEVGEGHPLRKQVENLLTSLGQELNRVEGANAG